MRIAVYGGSFNPPHVVHAMVASWLLWTEQVEEVWLVPVYRHAFEGIHNKALATYRHRVKWCKALTKEVDQRIKVSLIESELPIPSYSIDTLQALADTFPEYKFRLCIGSDVIPQLSQWKNWSSIESQFPPIIVGRVGYSSPKNVVQFPPVSSSQIREQLSIGIIPKHLLNGQVSRLIQENNPYRIV